MPNDNTTNPTIQAIPSRAEAQKLADAVLGRVKAKEALVEIEAEQSSRAEIARNQLLHLQGETNIKVALQVSIDGKRAKVQTQDLSPQGLAALVDEAEGMASQRITAGLQDLLPKAAEVRQPGNLFFDATVRQGDSALQGKTAQGIVKQCQDANVLAAGSLVHENGAQLIHSTTGYGGYVRKSYSEFTLSARTASGTGAGWAWAGTEDAGKVDAGDVARRAIDLAQRTENPSAVEPGRYTVILEPEALAQLLDVTVRWSTMFLGINAAENRGNVFSRPGGKTRIGEQMTDARVQFFYDPYDPLLPFSPLHDQALLQKTFWLQDGVLRELAMDPASARMRTREHAVVNPLIARLDVSGPTQTLEQMIASTKRGIWVHHLGSISMVDWETQLLTGVSRNGTFLIENGKISRPIKNMRFTESPFFILNKLDAASAAVRAHRTIACPRLKIHDFEFTSLSDAI